MGLCFSRESAKIKAMSIWFTALSIWVAQSHGVQCESKDVEAHGREIERIDQRYQDFFKEREHLEGRIQEMNQGVNEVRAERLARQKRLDQARQEYRVSPRNQAREDALQAQWEREQKARTAEFEQKRLCEVQQRDRAKTILQRGKKIPEMKEFDLEE